jgi:hypothetical protein
MEELALRFRLGSFAIDRGCTTMSIAVKVSQAY